MPFANDDLALKRNVPTLSVDTVDSYRFSQLVETTKDAFIEELRAFFATPAAAAARYAEILTIDKYAISALSTDPFENLVTLIREYPDILQKLPLISVTKASGSRRPIGITGAFVAHVQYPPRVQTTLPEPYNLSAILNVGTPPTVTITTRPDGITDRASTITLPTLFFPTPTTVTAAQLAAAINFQSLYASARAVVVGGSTFLQILAGGPLRISKPTALPAATNPRSYWSNEETTPDRIAITGGTATLLTTLGLTVGQSDDSNNPARPPCNRYGTAANFTIGLDVGATSDNERTELTDLLIYWLNLFMSDRDYTFYGQHVFEEAAAGATTERFFQITLNDFTMTGEADIPRPDGEREDKVYVNRFNIPVIVYDYVDRIIPANLIPPAFNIQQRTFIANGQPVNITGVVVNADLPPAPPVLTASGTGTLTYVAGTSTTLQWQAPLSGAPGAAVNVAAGGTFVLAGGDTSSIRVTVNAAGLPVSRASAPVNVTGVTIASVSATTPAGAGTLTFVHAGLVRTLQWDPPGAEGPGAAVNVIGGGTFTLLGAAGTSITVSVDPLRLPAAGAADTITITTTFTDLIALSREELPAAN